MTEQRNQRLTKEQINDIKFFIKKEVEAHKFGEWDRFRITSLRIHADGNYSFKINWYMNCAGMYENYWVEGNLFEQCPNFAVRDGLDAVQIIFQEIHINAFKRCIYWTKREIEKYNNHYEYLKKIYEPGGVYNKEEKELPIIDTTKEYEIKEYACR